MYLIKNCIWNFKFNSKINYGIMEELILYTGKWLSRSVLIIHYWYSKNRFFSINDLNMSKVIIFVKIYLILIQFSTWRSKKVKITIVTSTRDNIFLENVKKIVTLGFTPRGKFPRKPEPLENGAIRYMSDFQYYLKVHIL